MRGGGILALGVLCVACAAVAAPVTVVLDFLPNPNHVPLYLAAESGAFAARGLAVDLWVPSGASDAVRLVAARAADVGLTPQINYLIARAEGLPLVAIGALIDQALGGLLALGASGIATPADLADRPIGYSLAPLEPALWRAMLVCAGVAPDAIDLVNVGFNTVQALLSGRVAAIGAFRNVEPFQVELEGQTPVFFAEEAFCVPATYDLLFVVHPDTVARRKSDLESFLAAVAESIAATRADPERALSALLRAFPELDDELSRRSFAATLPLYADGLRHDDSAVWEAVGRFLVEHGILESEIPYSSLVDTTVLPARR